MRFSWFALERTPIFSSGRAGNGVELGGWCGGLGEGACGQECGEDAGDRSVKGLWWEGFQGESSTGDVIEGRRGRVTRMRAARDASELCELVG
jgi:hypothetical protein